MKPTVIREPWTSPTHLLHVVNDLVQVISGRCILRTPLIKKLKDLRSQFKTFNTNRKMLSHVDKLVDKQKDFPRLKEKQTRKDPWKKTPCRARKSCGIDFGILLAKVIQCSG